MIDVITLETSSLGDRSYLATDGQVAVVVDPQRDIDRVLDLVARLGVRVAHVLETHVHNDYVSGGLELAQRTGATYVLPAGSDADFAHTAVGDGEELTAGDMALRALLTPGHTHHHTSYTLARGGQVEAVFTGGSMLYGSTGRTDLVGPEHTLGLTHDQHRSVRRLAAELPASAAVYPTHGFGSFCSATPTSGDASTVGEQAATNPALTQDEQEFVTALIAGLDAYPAYYAHMGVANRRGPAPVDLSMPAQADGGELRRRIDAGEWVVDLRARRAFAAGHLAGSLGFELSGSFVTYLGWLHAWGTPLTLLGESEQQVLDARRELVRIGVDEVGASVGDVEALAGGQDLRTYPVTDADGLAGAVRAAEAGDTTATSGQPLVVLDTRLGSERAKGGVRGSVHVPLHELAERAGDLPDGQLWIHCGSGYRASIAASLLQRAGRDVVLVDDAYDHIAATGLTDAQTGQTQDT
ncbi:rhodanese-like domain-containing protein [uncultured Pseudokineococcus sp.]|uniref:MBL fold metallo-hydrolase n=1 Tax=uncultured Pseudokineococcus sp. TaxID=1642928 RepID=UPI002627C38E|nr:MBL fold metallo-hydrolase [uncultured Pseudokineococcus sp.]